MSNLEIWNRRWQALSTIITQLKNDIDTLDQQLMTAQEKKEHRIPKYKKLITKFYVRQMFYRNRRQKIRTSC